ncbi:MAG: tRNA 2-thiouridine(34) synthase MnmA [Candidatus Dependentiae bacterium]|nr:tRNA 2-thiouridine(34) synthase MnmA [Candidatus Dependentiae bacterium]
MKKIAVLVSGGVDSSVALALLKEQGHDVTAFYLKIWLEDELSYLGSCPWEQDLEFARGVCEKLNVPLKIISMQQEYHTRVVSYMLDDIRAGRTPNPDMLCNQQVKFGAFYHAIDNAPDGEVFEYVATGHYAQIEHTPTVSILKKGKDPVKDQTYFLAYLSQEQLKRALFPIGGFEKFEVRELARKYDLPTKDRKDSQGICFLGKFDFSDFLKAHLGTKAGDIIEFETGLKLGVHEGFWFYTIGQRQGLGLSGGPWYVVSKDAAKNIVYISKTYGAVTEHKSGMIISNFNWNQNVASSKSNLDVRFRHGPAVHAATVTAGGADLTIMLTTESKQGIAAGQFAVLYDGDVCLGGGIIEQAL